MKNAHAAQPFPWADWFSFAITTLGLTPAAFWQLSVREWAWLMASHTSAVPSRGDISALRDLFLHYPDETHG
ncbi:MAG: phage tail assembly chaperone [Pseudomonadota bacterium]